MSSIFTAFNKPSFVHELFRNCGSSATISSISLHNFDTKNVSYNDVLTSQRAMVGAKQALIGAELSKSMSAITLYKVLGGGTTVAEAQPADKE